MFLIGVMREGREWWHIKLYIHTPNRLGTPEISATTGEPVPLPCPRRIEVKIIMIKKAVNEEEIHHI